MNTDEFEKIASMDETMILSGWEQENPAFRQFLTSSFLPKCIKRTDGFI